MAVGEPAVSGTAEVLPAEMLEGYLDFNDGKRLFGWAWCRSRPTEPVEIEIRVDDQPVLTVLADRLRQDLIAAGLPDGRHGFNVVLPEPLPIDQRNRISAQICAAPGKPAKPLVTTEARSRPLRPPIEKAGDNASAGPHKPSRIKQVVGTLIGGQKSIQSALAGLNSQLEHYGAERREVDGAAIVTLTKTVEQLHGVQETLARQAAAVEILQTRLDAATAALSDRDGLGAPRRDDRTLYWIVGGLAMLSVVSLGIGLYSLLA